MRIRHAFVFGLVSLLSILVVGGITAFANTGPTLPQGNGTPQHNKTAPPPGVPAITPRIHGTPAFATEDVRLYYQNHSFSAGSTVSGAPPTIKSIRFMTSREARGIMKGEFVGIPDSGMVCYVELHGPFYTTMISVPPGQSLPPTIDKGIEVFDAQTGNLLLWGLA